MKDREQFKKTKIDIQTLHLIAEIGINHNGDLNVAKELIKNAKDAGFHSVKFQKRTIEKVYSKEILDSKKTKSMGNHSKRTKKWIRIWKKRIR